MAYYKTARIKQIIKENYRVSTFVLDASVDARAGQFVMLWLPRENEKPMCIVNADPLMLSIANVGDFTKKIFELREGDEMSFRGPLGNSFWFEDVVERVLMVGGGYGVAALNFLAEEALKKKIEVTMVIAARKKEDVIFEKNFAEKAIEALVSTDDGSQGFRGRAHELVEKLLSEGRRFDCLYACGPEKMMHALALVCGREKIACQLSLERYMGCGLGMCGKCDAGGKLVCADGPVFTVEQTLKLEEFGKTHRDTSGHKIPW